MQPDTISANQNVNNESLNIKALQETALELWAVDQASALELGRALIAVRDAMTEHGAFAKWFRDAGLDESRVYYCIRKAEGKVKSGPKEDAPAFQLNRQNLAVVKVAPKANGKSVIAALHVGKHGTTATDGFVLVRVSLPPDSAAPENEGVLAGDMAARFMSSGFATEVSFAKAATTIKNGWETTTLPKYPAEFPPADEVLAKVRENVFQCAFKVNALHKLVCAANDFDPEGEILLSFSSDFVRGDMTANGQTWLGLAMTKSASTYKELKEADAEEVVQ
jgi:hypothetical protein